MEKGILKFNAIIHLIIKKWAYVKTSNSLILKLEN